MKRLVFKGTLVAWSIVYVLFFTITSCSKDDTLGEQYRKLEQNGYSVTVFWNNKQGTVDITSEPCKYSDCDMITLTATANSGYRFVEWQVTEDGIPISYSIDNTVSFGMSSDCNTIVWKAIFVSSLTLPESITVSQYNTESGNKYETIQMYKYDIQNRLIGATTVSGDYISDSFGMNYNDDEYFVKFQTCYSLARCFRATFSQNGNKISFTTSLGLAANSGGFGNGELELNAQGLPIKMNYEEEYYGMYTNRFTSTVLYLTWQNGNLTVTDWESEIEIESGYWTETEIEIEKKSDRGTITYTYDDKKTPFYYCNMPKWFFLWLSYFRYDYIYWFNENNVKTETREDGSSTTYEYTYNNDGFPVTRTGANSIWWVDETTTETYKYHK